MRIQTRLFVGTAMLVLALMGVQWWLHQRQLNSIEQELATVATTVGKRLLEAEPWVMMQHLRFPEECKGEPQVWMEEIIAKERMDGVHEGAEQAEETGVAEMEVFVLATGEGAVPPKVQVIAEEAEITQVKGEPQVKFEWSMETTEAEQSEGSDDEDRPNQHRLIRLSEVQGGSTRHVRRVHLKVIDGDEPLERYLVATGEADFREKIPLPVSETVQTFTTNLRHGLGLSAALLVAGLVASGVLSNRLARPLQQLADRSDALGRGDLGVQVPVTASGEVGELQRAFNRMSQRLAELEREKEGWRQREHLAQLGDLARGLAHTLRNPLNTLGLTVEEMAEGEQGSARLVGMARAQIRRIDRWLRSFLAIGAGDAAELEQVDLAALVESVVLEAVQQGAAVHLGSGDEQVLVHGIPNALRAAVVNLLENAVQASPKGERVEVSVSRTADRVEVCIRDHGPGLPEEVRQRLFSPHVTTKVGGSGMGLFLARQLVVNMHHGELALTDAPGGGTRAVVRLPLLAAEET